MYHRYLLALWVFLSFLISGDVLALGLGFSVSTGAERSEDDNLVKNDRDITSAGMLIDTNVSRENLFSYRFTLLREENDADNGIDMKGLATTHTFGFGINSNKRYRFWMGPELHTAFYNKLYQNNTKINGDVTGVSIGPAVGVNLHSSNIISFSLSLSYYIIGSFSGSGSSIFVSANDLDFDSEGFHINATMIFRVREK